MCGSRPWGAAAFHLCLFILLLKCFKCSPVPSSFFPYLSSSLQYNLWASGETAIFLTFQTPPTGRLFLFRPMRQIHPINIQFNCGVNHFVFILYFYLNSTSIAISWSTTKEPQGKWVQMFRAPFLYLPGAPNSPNPPCRGLPVQREWEGLGLGTRSAPPGVRSRPWRRGLSENHWPRQVPTLSQHDHTHLNPNRAPGTYICAYYAMLFYIWFMKSIAMYVVSLFYCIYLSQKREMQQWQLKVRNERENVQMHRVAKLFPLANIQC